MTQKMTQQQTQQQTPTPSHPAVRSRRRHIARIGTTGLAAGALVVGLAAASSALIQPGTPARDVTIGLDNDTADNPFIQPPGVSTPQHMNGTDVLFGRDNQDLLIGNRGSDTLLGGSGGDILVGGPDRGPTPGNDVLVGDLGNDIAVWSPGDDNDAFTGNEDRDTMIFAPLVETASGAPLLTWHDGRKIPHVTIDGVAHVSCTVVTVPTAENLGFQHLARFLVDGTPVATVRLKDVERVLCPSPQDGMVEVARLADAVPTFRSVPLGRIAGTAGAILSPVR